MYSVPNIHYLPAHVYQSTAAEFTGAVCTDSPLVHFDTLKAGGEVCLNKIRSLFCAGVSVCDVFRLPGSVFADHSVRCKVDSGMSVSRAQ